MPPLLQRKSEEKVRPVFDVTKIEDLPQKFSNMLQSLTFEEKQLFLRDILEKVIVGDGSKISVKGCIPLESEVQNNGFWPIGRDYWFTKCGEVNTF